MMIKFGVDHCFQYFETVIITLMPFICIAPSPMKPMTVRSGNAILAARAYGVAAPNDARLPESDPFMPRRILMSRAYQLATEPLSPVMMQLSGSRDDNSQNTRCGLIGSADSIARSSIVSHQLETSFSISCRQLLSVFC